MQGSFVKTPLMGFVGHLTRGCTIWRPVVNGQPATIYPETSERSGGIIVRVQPHSTHPSLLTFEPTLNPYRPGNKGGKVSGTACFVVSSDGSTPMNYLPDNWYCLVVISRGKDGRCLWATPVTTDDKGMGDYILYREIMHHVYQQENFIDSAVDGQFQGKKNRQYFLPTTEQGTLLVWQPSSPTASNPLKTCGTHQ